jgi:hypothetical protein
MNDATPDCIYQPAFPGQRQPYYQKRSAWLIPISSRFVRTLPWRHADKCASAATAWTR